MRLLREQTLCLHQRYHWECVRARRLLVWLFILSGFRGTHDGDGNSAGTRIQVEGSVS